MFFDGEEVSSVFRLQGGQQWVPLARRSVVCSEGEEVNGGFLCRGGRWCVQKARSTVGSDGEEVKSV